VIKAVLPALKIVFVAMFTDVQFECQSQAGKVR